MTKYLAGVLTVIAAGVLLIAYGLLTAGAAAEASSALAPVSPAMAWGDQAPMRVPVGYVGYGYVPAGYVHAGQATPYSPLPEGAASSARSMYVPTGYAQPVFATPAYTPQTYADPAVMTAPAPRPVRTVSDEKVAWRRSSAQSVERKPQSTWKRAALIIGGASAAGAGVGAMVGGKKGALIGAAIGGGAGTIYQTTK